jgi:glycine betaine/proline transport system substrate-binding protein
MKKTLKQLGIVTGLFLSLVVAGCGAEDNNKDNNQSGNKEDKGTEQAVNYSEQMEYTITGIEPGAGITKATENAVDKYENLSNWEFNISSTAAMTTALGEAIENKEPIVITGWTPHWTFAKYDLKYLKDPKGVYGDVEIIATLARKGLKEDMPIAYEILDRFHWEPADMEKVMLATQEDGVEFKDAAKDWIEANSDKVAKWTKGVEKVNGKEIELVLTPWDTERASTNVIGEVLRQQGFDVKLTPVDPAVAFQSVATGDGDATVAAWLPATHGAFYEEYKDQLVDLGENLKGAKIGLVVPTYMKIDSIEDLKPAE